MNGIVIISPRRVVGCLALLCSLAVQAELPLVTVAPSQVLSQTQPVVAISMGQEVRAKAASVTIGGQSAEVQQPAVETKSSDAQQPTGAKPPTGPLLVKVPALDVIGRADVVVRDKENKPIARGQIEYAEPGGVAWGGVVAIAIFAVLLGIIPLGITWYDVRRSYGERQLVLSLVKEPQKPEDVRQILRDLDRGPTGLSGLTRGLLTISLVLIIGFAVSYLIVFTPNISELADRLLMLVAGTLTSMTGFYFGSRAASDAASKASSDQGSSPPAGSPSIDSCDPVSAVVGASTRVTLKGRRFGSQQGEIQIGNDKGQSLPGVAIANVSWSESEIKFDLPPSSTATAANARIVVVTKDGKRSNPWPFEIK